MRIGRASAAGLLVAVLALAGCAGAGADSGPVLKTTRTSLGEIVVDGDGMTVYLDAEDTQGAASGSCTGDCLASWPPVTTTTAHPRTEGLTGAVGVVKTPDGQLQVTLDGWPLYRFDGDTVAGNVKGEGIGGVWWAVSPAGERVAP